MALKHHHGECNVDFSIIERKAGAVKLADVGVIAEIGCARRQHLWSDIAAHQTTGNMRVQRTQVPSRTRSEFQGRLADTVGWRKPLSVIERSYR